ncbi:probable protein S-acyltransferase 12 [Pecten maximus]|uniref:probable protein S-acyltransferase 12 n=1 Tax=Pecten maximus TaxID=6579 RepID=UPI0014584B90|nr:probable protein S-acyltransferase 12 [Pecten maximus]
MNNRCAVLSVCLDTSSLHLYTRGDLSRCGDWGNRHLKINNMKTFASLRVTAMDKDLSLPQKILQRFDERRGELGANPRTMNKYSPFLFIAEVTGVWYYGTFQAIPFLYAGYDGLTVTVIQALVCFLAFEVVINWWYVYTVDSNYYPQLHGTPQEYELHSLLQVVTNTDSQTKRRDADRTKTVPTSGYYWSWKYCAVCDQPRPPRCHHCMLCNRCSLKRDHHCFFARNCIGYRNLRHFTVMIFWASLSSVIGFVHAVPFIFMEVLPSDCFYIDVLPFVAFVRWIFGYSHFRVGIIVLGLWFLFMFVILTTAMMNDSYKLIIQGKTSYEVDNDILISDTRNTRDKIRAVFGKYWLLNFVMPMHWLFEPEVDPVNWPTINT